MPDVIGVIHPVADLAAARAFLEALGMPLRDGGDGFAVLDSGAVRIRLVHSAEPRPLELEVEARDVGAAVDALAPSGARALAPALRSGSRLEQSVAGPGGITVRLVQPLNEDELGVVPPLPAHRAWADAADTLLREVLRVVPILFRDLARRKVTQRAEAFAASAGAQRVEVAHAIRGLFDATPRFQHGRLREALVAQGLPERTVDALAAEGPPA